MKIAILTPTFSHFSGIDRLVEIKCRDFIKKGHKVDIFTLSASIKPKKAGLYILGMPKNPFLERLYRLFFFLDIKKIKKYTNILKSYNIIISHLYPMNLLAYKAKKKNKNLKYIYHNAGVGIVETYSFLEKLYLRIFNYFTNKTIRNADEVISISNFLKKELKKETGIDSKVEYAPIDKKRFHKGINGDKIRKKYNIKNEPVFLYVGRISPHKGVHLLIRAFKLVQKNYPKAKLIIIGKHTFPKYTKKLKKIANKNVIFAGFVPDKELPYYYAACNIYTTASLWEGFDIPVCLPPGSKIKSNGSYKEIESFTGGESVLTHRGGYREVIEKTKRNYKGPLIGIYCFGHTHPIRLTPEHKIYSIKTKKCKKSETCKPICLEKDGCRRRFFEDYSSEWVRAKDIIKGDVVLLPYANEVKDKKYILISDYVKNLINENGAMYYKYSRKTEKGKETYSSIGNILGVSKNAIYRVINNLKEEIDKDKLKGIKEYLKKIDHEPREKIRLKNKVRLSKNLMRLFGYYVAEGCAPKSGNVICFSFNSKEKEYYADVISIIKKVFNLNCLLEIKGNKCRITCSSKILNSMFKKLFGNDAKTRYIPQFLLSLPKNKISELLKGAWYGDGHKYFAYFTSSKILANNIRDILLKLSIYSYIKEYKRKKRHIEYKVMIAAPHYPKLCDILKLKYKPNKKRRTHSKGWIDDKLIYSMVRKTERRKYNGLVYNLEVEKDKSYCTEMASVHNCEANLTGKPAVAFNVGSHPEVVKKGILVKENDVKGFADAIIKIIRKKC